VTRRAGLRVSLSALLASWLVHAAAAATPSAAPPTAPSPSAAAPAAPTAPVGELKSLGNERYQIGRVIVDKSARSFRVPGRILLLGSPLEYVAGSPGGIKNYETLLEISATSTEFNLACILIGLERPANQPAYQQFSRVQLVGPRVAIRVEWQEGGNRKSMPAAEALLGSQSKVKPETVEWVYTGGNPVPPPAGGPRDFGILIGFVHDPNSIIEAALGIGIGAYGSVRGNSALPPVGTPIELVIEAVRSGK